MKLDLIRYSKTGERQRESDKAAVVQWAVRLQSNGLYITTEHGQTYFLDAEDTKEELISKEAPNG